MANWMKDAVKPEHRGKFSAKAAKAGMSTSEYAAKVLKSDKASTTTKKEANLAKTFNKYRP